MRSLTLPESGTVDLNQRIRRQPLLQPERGDQAKQERPGLHGSHVTAARGTLTTLSRNLPRTLRGERSVPVRALFLLAP